MANYQQKRPVVSPSSADKTLKEFSSVIQDNLAQLWEHSHDHIVSQATKNAYAALATDTDRIAFIAGFIGLL